MRAARCDLSTALAPRTSAAGIGAAKTKTGGCAGPTIAFDAAARQHSARVRMLKFFVFLSAFSPLGPVACGRAH